MTRRLDLKKGLTRAVLGAAVLAASLGSAGMGQAAEVHLLWVQAMKDHPVHRLMQAGFLDKCKELGYICEVVGDPSATNWDIPATLPLAEAAIARTKYDAIGVYGPDPAIYSYITKLSKEGFPVVTWHVLPPEGTVEGLKAATGEDIPNAGEQGERNNDQEFRTEKRADPSRARRCGARRIAGLGRRGSGHRGAPALGAGHEGP
ncbi:MAG: hypothetical protein Q7T08_07990, partial [Devosia sp.]|nr:hypothetical protein [Devosia sp.]